MIRVAEKLPDFFNLLCLIVKVMCLRVGEKLFEHSHV